jgi:hypothetical protein
MEWWCGRVRVFEGEGGDGQGSGSIWAESGGSIGSGFAVDGGGEGRGGG